jgi:hypothetical protein
MSVEYIASAPCDFTFESKYHFLNSLFSSCLGGWTVMGWITVHVQHGQKEWDPIPSEQEARHLSHSCNPSFMGVIDKRKACSLFMLTLQNRVVGPQNLSAVPNQAWWYFLQVTTYSWEVSTWTIPQHSSCFTNFVFWAETSLWHWWSHLCCSKRDTPSHPSKWRNIAKILRIGSHH